MGMRIWYQSMTQLATLTNYRKALEEHAKKYCSDGTKIVFNGVSEDNYHGRMPAEVLQYSYAKLILQTEVIDICRAAEKNKFGFAAIESISHNNVIINNLLLKTAPLIISPTAYFFYNFAYNTFKPEKVLIIN